MGQYILVRLAPDVGTLGFGGKKKAGTVPPGSTKGSLYGLAMLTNGEMKWPLWRSVEGEIRIEGRRQNGTPDDFLEVDIPGGYGRTGFQVLGLTFSAQGCWEVTARVGTDALTFVVAVYVP